MHPSPLLSGYGLLGMLPDTAEVSVIDKVDHGVNWCELSHAASLIGCLVSVWLCFATGGILARLTLSAWYRAIWSRVIVAASMLPQGQIAELPGAPFADRL